MNDLLIALISSGATALLGSVGYLFKRWFEKRDQSTMDNFLDRFERLREIASAENPPQATKQEFDKANRIVEASRAHPAATGDVLQSEHGAHFTQSDMNRVAAAQLSQADAALQITSIELMSRYDGGLAEAFQDALSQWERFRHDYSAYAAEQYAGGSIAPLIYSATAERLTKQFHIILLDQLEEDRNLRAM